MKIVLHCGIHRTGTTSLQQFLADNRAALGAKRVRYPGDGVHHQHLAWGLKRGEVSADDLLRTIEAQGGKVDTVILSAEDFSILTDLRWAETIGRAYPTRAVFYLRRQDHWVMSWYNQHVKWPFEPRKARMGPRNFLSTLEDFHWLDYSALLARWEAALGPESISVGVVEKDQVGDVVEDFLHRAGIGHEGLSFDSQRVNDSLPVHVLEIARHLGLASMRPDQRTRLLAALRAGLADKTPEVSTLYSPEERQQILHRFAAANRHVAERYFGREALFLEPPPAPDAPYFRFPNMPRQELMREWVAPVIRELLKADGRK